MCEITSFQYKSIFKHGYIAKPGPETQLILKNYEQRENKIEWEVSDNLNSLSTFGVIVLESSYWI